MHARDGFARARRLVPLLAGLSPSWWAQKHSAHHVFTNVADVDGDIRDSAPLLYFSPPRVAEDSPLRRIQHWTLPGLFSLLGPMWFARSLSSAADVSELFFLAAHWAAFLAVLPLTVALSSLALSSLALASIVTSSHSFEERSSAVSASMFLNVVGDSRAVALWGLACRRRESPEARGICPGEAASEIVQERRRP